MRYYVNREEKKVIADNSQLDNNLTQCGYEQISSVEYERLNKEYSEEYRKNFKYKINNLWER